MDIRKQQKQAILKMLALNEDDETSAEAPIDWKVLILDEPCRELLAPLVSVNELRARGVTLHAPIESPRDALGDVAVAVGGRGPWVAPARQTRAARRRSDRGAPRSGAGSEILT